MIIEYIIAVIVSIAIDGVWLGVISSALYKKYIGDLMLSTPKLTPALLFYLVFGVAMVVFIINPAIKNDWSIGRILFHAVVLGLVVYGGYDLTNLAILKGWSVAITFIDIAWGITFTSIVAFATVYLSKLFIK